MSSNNIPLKLLQGTRNSLDSEALKPGYIYYCIDSNELFFDFESGRKCLNPYIYDEIYGSTEINPDVKGLINKQDKEIIDTAVRFALQELTGEQKKQARLNIDAVGEKTLEGGEIFNDYENNVASAEYAHAEGTRTSATGLYSHAEGEGTQATKQGSHAEGYGASATGLYAHAEGEFTEAKGQSSHAEGYMSFALSSNAHAEGYSTQVTQNAVSSHAEGYGTEAAGNYGSHAEGYYTTASGESSHAEGGNTSAENANTHAEGSYTVAKGTNSHAEGFESLASGTNSHAEGASCEASGENSHAEGYDTTASGQYSHAKGDSTLASGKGSYAEGYKSQATAKYSHAEGYNSKASGENSHAEGNNTVTNGINSHAEGQQTIASSPAQHVQGKYNIEDTESKYAHIVGNGTSNSKRSNAHTIDWEGNAWFAGDVRVGGTGHDEGFDVPLTTKINIPKGRMRGDVDGDGRITTIDANMIQKYLANQNSITDDIQLWCADVSTNGTYNIADVNMIGVFIYDIKPLSYLMANTDQVDYYNNWYLDTTYNADGYFYVDYHVEGMTADSSATLIINGSIIEGNFAELVCSENNLRLYANFCPINDQTAMLVWSKTGNTTSIVDNIIGHNDNSYTTSIKIPFGRMKGDINGDGKINGADFELMVNHLNGTSVITDTTQLWCLDVNSSGTYSIMDQQALGTIINGTSTIALADYYDNWTFNTTDRLFYTDITIAGMTPACSATLFVQGDFEKGNYVKIECLDNAIRIYAKYCPISAFNATVSWTVDGLAVTNVIENPLADTGTQTKLLNITIPYGRMRGDIDGDGEITEADSLLLLRHNANISLITDETALLAADVNNDSSIDSLDVTLINKLISNEEKIGTYGEISGNWEVNDSYDEDEMQFYVDINIPDMTFNSNVILYIDNYYTGKSKFNIVQQLGGLRIYTTLCPVEDIDCVISYSVDGQGVTSIVQNKPDAVDTSDYIIVAGDTSITTQEVCNIYNSGRTVWCSYNAAWLLLPVSYVDDNYIEFYMVYDNVAYKLIYQKDVWSAESTKLSDITVMLEEQTLTDEQKEQVRTNIGAGINPYMTKITLTTSGWDATALTQVATIEGIKADETAQAIYINPVFDDTMIDEIGNCNVYASAQGENSITFSCDSVPTINVEFYVKWQDVIWIEPPIIEPSVINITSENIEDYFEISYGDEDSYQFYWNENNEFVNDWSIAISRFVVADFSTPTLKALTDLDLSLIANIENPGTSNSLVISSSNSDFESIRLGNNTDLSASVNIHLNKDDTITFKHTFDSSIVKLSEIKVTL